MNDNKSIILPSMEVLTHDIAVEIVEMCKQATEEEVGEILFYACRSLENNKTKYTLEEISDFIHIIYKGLSQISKKAEAAKYFLMGYYVKKQENILEETKEYLMDKHRKELLSNRYISGIMRYLYNHHLSENDVIESMFKIDESTLCGLMEEIEKCGLVLIYHGKNHTFYTLSSNGYSFCREHELV